MDRPYDVIDFGLQDTRNGFLPPRYRIHQLPHAADWSAIPPVAWVSDGQGEEVCPVGVELKLAHDTDRLMLRARIRDTDLAVRDVPADHRRFWEQDHIEFRFLRAPRQQVQVILSPEGKAFDSAGAFKRGHVESWAQRTADGWEGGWSIPLDALGRGELTVGELLAGQVAYTRYRDDSLQFWTFSPTEIGYGQEERFGQFAVAGPPEGPRLIRARAAGETLSAGANRLRLAFAEAGGTPITLRSECDGQCHEQTLTVAPDGSAFAEVKLTRPELSRLTVLNGPDVLAAWTLRAGVPEVAADLPPHPRLGTDVVEGNLPAESDVDLPALAAEEFPDPDTPETYFFHLMEPAGWKEAGWFRVCRESLCRDGARGHGVRGYIWSLLDEPARQAAREVSENVKLDDPQRAPLREAFNRLVMMEDFYQPEVFEGTAMPPVGHRLLAKRQAEGLSPVERARLNRLLIQLSIECIHCFGAGLLTETLKLGRAWRASGDAELLAEITRRLEAFQALYLPDSHTHLHEGNAAKQIGALYDQACPHLDEPARAVWLGVVNLYLEQFVHSARQHSWTVTCIPNANGVTNGSLGQLALSAWGDAPLAAEALRWARKHICIFMDYCTGHDGGNTEGTMYQNYGMSNTLGFGLAMERLIGTDDGIFQHPGWTKYMEMVKLAATNDGGMHGVNDTTPAPYSGRHAWFIAGRYNDPLALWWGDHCQRMVDVYKQRGQRMPISPAPKTHRPDGPECFDQPPLPTCMVLDGIQYGVMRSGSNYDCNLVVGVKGAKPPYTHHNQHDAGAFYLHLAGERLMLDPGYHKGAATDHCLPLIGGRGPGNEGFVGKFFACREGEGWRYLGIDTTPAYAHAAARVRRHLVMLGESALVILDDIATEAEVCLQFQCGRVTEAIGQAGKAFAVHGKQVDLRVEVFEPGGAVELQAERTLMDTHFGYNFADARLFPAHYVYTPAGDTPAVTVIQQADAHVEPTVRATDEAIDIDLPALGALHLAFQNAAWTLAEVAGR